MGLYGLTSSQDIGDDHHPLVVWVFRSHEAFDCEDFVRRLQEEYRTASEMKQRQKEDAEKCLATQTFVGTAFCTSSKLNTAGNQEVIKPLFYIESLHFWSLKFRVFFTSSGKNFRVGTASRHEKDRKRRLAESLRIDSRQRAAKDGLVIQEVMYCQTMRLWRSIMEFTSDG